ncbi:MAG: hypothetical protein VKJ06_01340 [Vampirovibrionales bacterium]|nr:hypothetical protein [Vampirovibrionales bacterium]
MGSVLLRGGLALASVAVGGAFLASCNDKKAQNGGNGPESGTSAFSNSEQLRREQSPMPKNDYAEPRFGTIAPSNQGARSQAPDYTMPQGAVRENTESAQADPPLSLERSNAFVSEEQLIRLQELVNYGGSELKGGSVLPGTRDNIGKLKTIQVNENNNFRGTNNQTEGFTVDAQTGNILHRTDAFGETLRLESETAMRAEIETVLDESKAIQQEGGWTSDPDMCSRIPNGSTNPCTQQELPDFPQN